LRPAVRDARLTWGRAGRRSLARPSSLIPLAASCSRGSGACGLSSIRFSPGSGVDGKGPFVHPWFMRAEGEVVVFPSERVEAWARFDEFFEEWRKNHIVDLVIGTPPRGARQNHPAR
jgi:hypothetical protein